MDQIFSFHYVAAAIVYSLLGIAILLFSSWVFDMITPRKMWIEIVEEKNLPLAVAFGAMTLGVAQIIAASIHG